MPRPKGPKFDKVLGVAVSNLTAGRLRAIAEAQRRTVSEMQRIILEDGIVRQERELGIGKKLATAGR